MNWQEERDKTLEALYEGTEELRHIERIIKAAVRDISITPIADNAILRALSAIQLAIELAGDRLSEIEPDGE